MVKQSPLHVRPGVAGITALLAFTFFGVSILVGLSQSGDVPLATDKRVLIHCDTVWPQDATCWEAEIATGLGFTPDIVCPDDWNAIVTATANHTAPPSPYLRFGQYWAVILGDPNCSPEPLGLDEVETSKSVWSPIVRNGNIIIQGEDFRFHADDRVGARVFMTNAVRFVTDSPTYTGLFASLSCYYEGDQGNPVVTPVTSLSLLSSVGGSFTVTGQRAEHAHIVAAHPTLAALDDSLLSNYQESSHEVFRSWPADFIVLATMLDADPANRIYTAGDSTVGAPYILSKGNGLIPIVPCFAITSETLECIPTSQAYAWRFCLVSFTNSIKCLTILDLPPGIDVNQYTIPLPSDLRSGQFACVTLFLTNQAGLNDLCFSLGALSTNYDLLCSVTNCPAFSANQCPTNIVVVSCTNTPVSYTIRAPNDCYTNLVFTPPSGTIFTAGTTTTVHCQVTDCCNHTNNCDFTVLVQCNPVPLAWWTTNPGNIHYLTWPTGSGPWFLQSSTNYIIPGSWQTHYWATSPPIMWPTTNAQGFFRLFRTNP